jgi:hypothetical protein
MAKIKEKISWVLSDSAMLDPTQNINDLKKIGVFWGSWKTWRAYQTDNVICHDQVKVDELVQREFQKLCNFYIPNSVYASLDRPENIKVYGGEFVHDTINQEEIVAMHLAATTSDIVLMLGWDLGQRPEESDRLKNHQQQHYRNMIRQSFITYNQTQWVIVDHAGPIDPNIANLENVVSDSLNTILELR